MTPKTEYIVQWFRNRWIDQSSYPELKMARKEIALQKRMDDRFQYQIVKRTIIDEVVE